MHAEIVAEWLRDAEGDLALATVSKTRAIRYSHLCFHAQQAAEKAIKAVHIAMGQSAPRTHDLAFLLDALPESVVLPPSLLLLPVLTKYAVQYRYPGQAIPVARRDWLKAVELAKDACLWAKATVKGLR